MDAAIIVGVIWALGAALLLWPGVRRAGGSALGALLFWALAIAALTWVVMLVQHWSMPDAPPGPPRAPPPAPPSAPTLPQRGTVV